MPWLLRRHRAGRGARRDDLRRLAVAGVGLAQHVGLDGQDAVVVGCAAPEHGAGGHQRPLGLLDRSMWQAPQLSRATR